MTLIGGESFVSKRSQANANLLTRKDCNCTTFYWPSALPRRPWFQSVDGWRLQGSDESKCSITEGILKSQMNLGLSSCDTRTSAIRSCAHSSRFVGFLLYCSTISSDWGWRVTSQERPFQFPSVPWNIHHGGCTRWFPGPKTACPCPFSFIGPPFWSTEWTLFLDHRV